MKQKNKQETAGCYTTKCFHTANSKAWQHPEYNLVHRIHTRLSSVAKAVPWRHPTRTVLGGTGYPAKSDYQSDREAIGGPVDDIEHHGCGTWRSGS